MKGTIFLLNSELILNLVLEIIFSAAIRFNRFLSKENSRKSCAPPITPTAASASNAFRSFGDSPLTKSERFMFDGIHVQCKLHSCDKENGLIDIANSTFFYKGSFTLQNYIFDALYKER